MWWWPYGKDVKRGQVVRGLFGCGYAPGTFITLFTSEFLGLHYDAPTRSLRFRPFNPASDFTWEDFPMGGGRFSVSCRRQPGLIAAEVANHNPCVVTATVELILPDGQGDWELKVGDRVVRPSGAGKFLGRSTVRVSQELPAGRRIVVTAAPAKK